MSSIISSYWIHCVLLRWTPLKLRAETNIHTWIYISGAQQMGKYRRWHLGQDHRDGEEQKSCQGELWSNMKMMIMMTVLSYFCYLMTLWKIGAERASPFDHFELSGKINPFLHNIFIFVVVVVIIAILYFSAGTKKIIHYISICAHSFPFIFFYCRPTFVVLWSVCLAGGKASMGLELAWSVL